MVESGGLWFTALKPLIYRRKRLHGKGEGGMVALFNRRACCPGQRPRVIPADRPRNTIRGQLCQSMSTHGLSLSLFRKLRTVYVTTPKNLLSSHWSVWGSHSFTTITPLHAVRSVSGCFWDSRTIIPLTAAKLLFEWIHLDIASQTCFPLLLYTLPSFLISQIIVLTRLLSPSNHKIQV